MSGGVYKVPKRGTKIKNEPRILGAEPISDLREPKVLDHTTRAKSVEIQTGKQGETVKVRSHIRTKPKREE